MMQKNTTMLLLILALLLGLVSCSDDKKKEPDALLDVALQFTLPEGVSQAELSDWSVTLTDVNTGTVHAVTTQPDSALKLSFIVPAGFYRIEAKGKMTYRNADLLTKVAEVQAHSDGVELKTQGQVATLPLFVSHVAPDPAHVAYDGFVIAEIFGAGSVTPQGTSFFADKYFVLYNNTDHVLYADSLAIAESDFLTVQKSNYSPDIMSTDVAVGALYMIPGTGRDHPVLPGGKLLIVDNALDHTKANPNSWDETKANFEWFDESTNPQFSDVNNPAVADLDRIFSKTRTMWSPHTQGFKSYALVRMHASKDDYLSNYIYHYSYHIVGATGEADMTGTAYRVPNSWVVDAVNVSVPAMFKWLVTAPNLDKGYTYWAEFGWDASRLGKSVRRKVASREKGRAVLMDTNNSTLDFEPRVVANPFHQF